MRMRIKRHSSGGGRGGVRRVVGGVVLGEVGGEAGGVCRRSSSRVGKKEIS